MVRHSQNVKARDPAIGCRAFREGRGSTALFGGWQSGTATWASHIFPKEKVVLVIPDLGLGVERQPSGWISRREKTKNDFGRRFDLRHCASQSSYNYRGVRRRSSVIGRFTA
jgi:hypothetical protein